MTFVMQAVWPAVSFMASARQSRREPRELNAWTMTVFVLIGATLFTMLMSEPAAAQAINLSPIQSFLTTITTAITGTIGKSIATIAIFGTVVGWWLGRVEVGTLFWVLGGIVVVGSASAFVNSMWAT